MTNIEAIRKVVELVDEMANEIASENGCPLRGRDALVWNLGLDIHSEDLSELPKLAAYDLLRVMLVEAEVG